MSGVLTAMFGVMLLTDPGEIVDLEAAAAVSEDADRGGLTQRTRAADVTRAKIRSRTSDFDRREGVVMFEGDVQVTYESDYTMCSERLFVFLAASNALSRVVAVGNVSITNATRVGKCAVATYRRSAGEIEMYGDEKTKARLAESGQDASEVEGSRIRFWLDSEQVEVENSRLGAKSEGKAGVL